MWVSDGRSSDWHTHHAMGTRRGPAAAATACFPTGTVTRRTPLSALAAMVSRLAVGGSLTWRRKDPLDLSTRCHLTPSCHGSA